MIEDIRLSRPAFCTIVAMCGYGDCLISPVEGDKHVVYRELEEAGLIAGHTETELAHEYVEYHLMLADACERHG